MNIVNEAIFLLLHALVALGGMTAFIWSPILTGLVVVGLLELTVTALPGGTTLVKPVRFVRVGMVKWLVVYPLKKLWGLGGVMVTAAGRGAMFLLRRGYRRLQLWNRARRRARARTTT